MVYGPLGFRSLGRDKQGLFRAPRLLNKSCSSFYGALVVVGYLFEMRLSEHSPYQFEKAAYSFGAPTFSELMGCFGYKAACTSYVTFADSYPHHYPCAFRYTCTLNNDTSASKPFLSKIASH